MSCPIQRDDVSTAARPPYGKRHRLVLEGCRSINHPPSYAQAVVPLQRSLWLPSRPTMTWWTSRIAGSSPSPAMRGA